MAQPTSSSSEREISIVVNVPRLPPLPPPPPLPPSVVAWLSLGMPWGNGNYAPGILPPSSERLPRPRIVSPFLDVVRPRYAPLQPVNPEIRAKAAAVAQGVLEGFVERRKRLRQTSNVATAKEVPTPRPKNSPPIVPPPNKPYAPFTKPLPESVQKTQKTVREKLALYEKSGSWKVFWMEVAQKVCLFVVFGFFTVSSILPLFSLQPQWLPWTAIGSAFVLLFIYGKLQMSIMGRKKEHEALKLYHEMLSKRTFSNTPAKPYLGSNQLRTEGRLSSEKYFPLTPSSQELPKLLKSTRQTGITNAGGSFALACSFYGLDVSPQVAKAYLAAECAGMEDPSQMQWGRLARDVEHAGESLHRKRFSDYNTTMRQVRQTAYAMPSPFTAFSGRTLQPNEDESLALAKRFAEAQDLVAACFHLPSLKMLQAEIDRLTSSERQLDYAARHLVLIAKALGNNEVMQVEDLCQENILAFLKKSGGDHALFAGLLGNYKQFKEAIANAKDSKEARHYFTGMERYLKFGILPLYHRLYQAIGVSLPPDSAPSRASPPPVAAPAPAEVIPPANLSLCDKCALVWKVLKSKASEPFKAPRSVSGRAWALNTNKMLEEINSSIVRGYFSLHLFVGWVAVAALIFVEAYFFSNTWVVFGVNVAFLAMFPVRLLMQSRLESLNTEKNRLRIEEGFQQGPRLDAPLSSYPAEMHLYKQTVDHYGLEGVVRAFPTITPESPVELQEGEPTRDPVGTRPLPANLVLLHGSRSRASIVGNPDEV